MTDEPKPPADTSWIVLTDADLRPDPGLAAKEPGPVRKTWTGTQRAMFAAGLAVGSAVGVGLFQLIVWLWGLR